MGLVYAANEAQEDALNAIIGERDYQDAKLGTVDERPREVGTYLTLMRHQLATAEAAYAINDNDQPALAAMRKLVAVGVACFEQHGVPVRDVDSAVVEPAPWPPAKDARLAGLTNSRLHCMYDALRVKPLDATQAVTDLSGCIIMLSRYQIETELEARGDCPIPF